MPQGLHPSVLYFVQKPCSECWRLPRERIPYYDLTFLIAGCAEYGIDDAFFTVRAGEAVFVPAGAIRSARTAGMRCAAFNFTLPPEEKLVLPLIIPFSGNRHMDLLFAEYDRELFLSGQENSLKCQGIFLWILSDMLREPCRQNAHVRRMKEYIADHLSDKLSVAEVAAHVGLHPAYCGALFKREEGCTLLHYVQTRKIEQATRLLRDDALPIGKIAGLLGFEDIYYFSRVYKQVTGRSPLMQRRMWHGDKR